MTTKVHPSPFRVPELLSLQLRVAEMAVRGHAYDCERARKDAQAEKATALNLPQDILQRQLTAERDSRVWDDVQALLNELQWGLDDLEARDQMPDRIHELAKRIVKNIDE